MRGGQSRGLVPPDDRDPTGFLRASGLRRGRTRETKSISEQAVLATSAGAIADRLPTGELAADSGATEEIIDLQTLPRAKAGSQLALWEGLHRDDRAESYSVPVGEQPNRLSFRQPLSRNPLRLGNGFPPKACGNDESGQTLLGGPYRAAREPRA